MNYVLQEMRFLKSIALIASVLCISGCGSIFMHMMGARGRPVPLNQVYSLYYMTSPDLKKAYVFYSIPRRIATGMATSFGPLGDARAITIDIGAVKDTAKNRQEFGEGIHSDYKIGDHWVSEFDIGDNDPSKPHQDQVKIFYGFERRDRNEPMPYRGVWRKTREEAEQAAS
jgi:hypothetical protein